MQDPRQRRALNQLRSTPACAGSTAARAQRWTGSAEQHGAASVTTNVGLYQESRHLHFHVYHRGETDEQALAMYGHHDG